MTIANAAPSSVSGDELQIERKKLEVWCTPQEFHNKVDALAAKFSVEDRFNSPRLAFLRDCPAALPRRCACELFDKSKNGVHLGQRRGIFGLEFCEVLISVKKNAILFNVSD
jgi:hypothetical protein